MEMILKSNINKFCYGKKSVLHDIDLSVDKGELIVLTGLSGCGKTTLLRLLNGLIPAFYEGELDGTIELLGKNIVDYKKGELAKYIGNVFQNPKDQFFCDVVEDEIALVGENLGMLREELYEKVENVLDMLNISHLRKESVFNLSGGERQKVTIAGTLIYDTDIIFFDEPSSSLDYESISNFKDILKQLKRMGKTIIIAEHRLYYLKDLFDRLVYMKDQTIEKIYSNGEITSEICNVLELRTLDEKDVVAEKEELFGKDIIKVNQVNIRQKNKMLMSKLSFKLKENEVMGVIGANGVGKTTLAKTLCGLTGGKIETNYGKKQKQRIQNCYYVMQDVDSQIFLDTVENELLSCSNVINDDFLELIRMYLCESGLWESRVMHPQKLSGGQKQRLAVISSFLYKRNMIILDEPTSGLDYRHMVVMSNLITKKSNEVPFVIITHDTELLFKTCNSVLIIQRDNHIKFPVKGNEKLILDFMQSNKIPKYVEEG